MMTPTITLRQNDTVSSFVNLLLYSLEFKNTACYIYETQDNMHTSNTQIKEIEEKKSTINPQRKPTKPTQPNPPTPNFWESS